MERRQLPNEQFSLCLQFVDKRQTFHFKNLFLENAVKQMKRLVWVRLQWSS